MSTNDIEVQNLISGASVNRLTDLSLERMEISALPSKIGQLVDLQFLDLRSNKLNTLPDSLRNLVKLRHLVLGMNEFEILPAILGSLVGLQALYADKNKISNFTENVGDLVNLKELLLAYNQIESVSKNLGALTNLELLDLQWNQISDLPESIGHLASLRTLRLNGNRLAELPNGLALLTSLDSLNLSDNKLSVLPESLGHLVSLRRLGADRNAISALPENLLQLPRLKILSLADNRLTALPNFSQCNVDGLYLDLSNNDIRDIPDGWEQNGVFSVVRLGGNANLKRLPANLHTRRLDVSRCPNLVTLPEGIIVEERLDIEDSGLKELPDSLQNTSLFWKGLRITQQVAFRPETLTVDQIMEEPSTDHRNLMIERLGYTTFLERSPAAVVDSDQDAKYVRRLLRVNIPRDEPVVCLSIQILSNDQHIIHRVSSQVSTCEEAAAWLTRFDSTAPS